MFLEVSNLNVYYGMVQVLWDVSFKVEEREMVTIIGSNGAGKTTTLLTISGVLKPKSGKIFFKNEEITNLPSHEISKRGISLVPEGRRLFPNLTVTENLLMGAYNQRAREQRFETLKEVFELFPRLEERKKQVARTLSGGEAQMLAIARSLMSKPSLLMLDEPSLGLAPVLVEEVFEAIKNLKERGTTILLVEQNVAKGLEIADRGYILENGKITLEGRGKDLLKSEKVRKAYLAI